MNSVFENAERRSRNIENMRKVEKLNRLVRSWRNKFDTPPTAPLVFALNEQDKLLLNDITICDVADVDERDCSCGLETFFIGSHTNNAFYRIKISWNFKEHLKISEVALVLYRSV